MIPVYQPDIGPAEINNVLKALRAGDISGSGGRYLEQFERDFARYIGVKYAIAVSSGSTALHAACVALELKAGHEVIVASATNIATANAVVMTGAKIVPVDVEPETWNLDPHFLGPLLTARTRAIMVVHLYGHPAEMDLIMQFARDNNLAVIEDCAEAHGAVYHSQKVGSIGDMGCFSFYANKIITTGEGGMVTTNDDVFAARVKLLRNLAFAQPRFKHQVVGFNYRLTNMQAALGVAQLEKIDDIIERKRAIAGHYTERLRYVPGIQLPIERHNCTNVYWMYAIVVNPDRFGRSRNELMLDLQNAGIESRTMFCPMNLQPALVDHMMPYRSPVAESLWEYGLYLPSGPQLTMRDIDKVCGVIAR